MAADFNIKKKDSSPALRVVLQDDAGNAVDLTNASGVNFHMFLKSDFPGGSIKVEAAADIVNPPGVDGVVEYAWETDGSDTNEVGIYYGEFEVTWTAGGRTTFPNYTYLVISIIDDLDEDV